MSKKNSSNIATIKWKGSAGIEQSLSLHNELLKVFKTKEEILLDISELEDIDITGIQILLAAKKEAEEKNKIFNIVGNIPEVIKAYSDGFQVSLDSLLKQQEKENA